MKLVKMNKRMLKKTLRSAALCCAAAAAVIAPAPAFASAGTGADASSAPGGVYGSLDRHHWYNICSTYHNWYPELDRPTHPSTGSDSGSNNDTGNSGQTSAAPSGYASEVFDLINSQRSANGQSALTYSAEAAKVAQAKAEDMAAGNYFSHTSPTYGSAFDMLKANGVSYSSAGENIAKGQTSPSSVMKAWMNSSGHRANILSSSYKSVGIGCAADSSGTLYWVQVFIG